jgi:hypothetical protein
MFEISACRGDTGCPRTPGTNVCTPRGREGEPCTTSIDDGCVNDLVCRNGTCVPDDPAGCN